MTTNKTCRARIANDDECDKSCASWHDSDLADPLIVTTLQPFYNTVHYKIITVLDITLISAGPKMII